MLCVVTRKKVQQANVGLAKEFDLISKVHNAKLFSEYEQNEEGLQDSLKHRQWFLEFVGFSEKSETIGVVFCSGSMLRQFCMF